MPTACEVEMFSCSYQVVEMHEAILLPNHAFVSFVFVGSDVIMHDGAVH